MKISIIVPVYKAEKTLAACVQSVLSQDFSDFELILVDDGSPDDSGRLCDTLAGTDARVSVFHKANGGCTSARRLGVEKARGMWIMFVDSDDVLLPGALSCLCGYADAYPEADIVEGYVRREGLPDRTFSARHREFSCDGVRYADSLQESAKTEWNTFFCGTYAKLIRRALFSESAFQSPPWVKTGEDYQMLLCLSPRVRQAVKVNHPVYVYRDNADGLCATYPETTDYIFRRTMLEKEMIFSGFDGASAEFLWSNALRRRFFRLVIKRLRTDSDTLKIMAEEVKKLKSTDWKTRCCLKILSMPESSALRRRVLFFLFRKIYRLSRIFD